MRWIALLMLVGCVEEPLPVEEITDTDLWGEAPDDLFDPTHLLDVDIELDSGDWDALTMEGREFIPHIIGPDCFSGPFPNSYNWYPASVTVDGETTSEVGVRKKGFLGSQSKFRPSLKVDSDRFVDDQFFPDDTEHLTLNNSNQDPSRIHSCLAYTVFELAGVPAPRCHYATVTVNGESRGAYAHVEAIKADFLSWRFGDATGDLYEGTVSDFTEDWIVTFQVKTDDTDPGMGPLYDLMDALDVPDDGLMSSLGSVLNVDGFITMWAVESLIGHWDGYALGTNNFYVYRSPEDQLLHFIPWGADAVFEEPESEVLFSSSEIAARLWDHPDGRAAYLAETQRLLDDVWDEDFLLEEVDRMWDLIEPHVLDSEAIGEQVDVVREFVEGRRAVIQDMVDSGGPDRSYTERPKECVPILGEVSAEFNFQWGTLADEPFGADGSIALNFGGYDVSYPMMGGLAGVDEENGPILLVMGMDPSVGEIQYAGLSLSTNMGPGTYGVDLGLVTGFMLALDLASGAQEPELWGFIGGEVTFDELGFTPGAPISGHFSGEIIPNIFGEF